MKVLLSAFACDPFSGSESAYGWSWATGLADKDFEVHCITRGINRENIERKSKPDHLHFHYVSLPFGMESFYSLSQPTMYLYYMLWQWYAYKKGKSLHKRIAFDVIHHVTWGSLQMGSFLYKLKIPFIFGPAGGGQKAPKAFKKYFLTYWSSELKRERVSNLLLNYSPACKPMLHQAISVLVANTDTERLAQEAGTKNYSIVLDVALPESFFPEFSTPKKPMHDTLKLLWVGRFMPRKGVLLMLDVMNELKEYPGITLTLVGDGEMKNEIVRQIDKYGLQSSINMVGSVPYEKVRDYYASHDVFFYTSLRDSGSVQLIEAMAFSLPVVTLNLHGQAMIVNDETGIRCACDTPEIAIKALKSSIVNLFNNPQKVTLMSQAANDFARRQTWNHKIANIVDQYYPRPSALRQ